MFVDLFGDPVSAPGDTIPSPLCIYQSRTAAKCRKGLAVLGPVDRVDEACENRSITCLQCGATGVQSRNLALTGPRQGRAS